MYLLGVNAHQVVGIKKCRIKEVIKDFHSIEEVVFGSELYCFATEFFMVRSRREIWAAIEDKKKKIQLLKLMFERRSNVNLDVNVNLLLCTYNYFYTISQQLKFIVLSYVFCSII